MRILGIDPSLTSTGLVLVEEGVVVATERVRVRARGYVRVDAITRHIERVIWGPSGRRHEMGYEPTGDSCDDEAAPSGLRVGIEGPAMGAKGSSVVQIFGLWGVLTQRLWEWGVSPYVIPPTSLKKYATGRGNASKDEVLAAVVRRYGDVDVTGNDVADALVVAAMGARHYGASLEGTLMPGANLEALRKVEWNG